jgi:hypothetical protein
VSSLCFHAADTFNQIILPARWAARLAPAQAQCSWLKRPLCPLCVSAYEVDSVVTKMINPEGNDLFAMFLGSLAPCVSAPWWEEVSPSAGSEQGATFATDV